MEHVLIEQTENGKRAHKSLIVEPRKLSVLNNQLVLDIMRELTVEPACAMDLARRLQEDEQKVYYYLRKLERSGLIILTRMERRHGMTAKIYELKAPVVSAKLHDNGYAIPEEQNMQNPDILNFFSPFIEDGKLNGVVVIGDPYSHGRFDSFSKEAPFIFDLAVLFGSLIKDFRFPHYLLDTEVKEEDLKKNLILIGNIKSNVIIDRINTGLPIYYTGDKEFSIFSKATSKNYTDPRVGLILKIKNPFNPDKKILVIGGVGSRGSRSAIISLTQRIDKLSFANNGGEIHRVVKGFDKNGDGVIDDVEVLE